MMNGSGSGSSSSSSGKKIDTNMEVTFKRVADCQFPTREGCCSCSVGNKMYVFGGVIHSSTDELVESNELLCYDGGWCS